MSMPPIGDQLPQPTVLPPQAPTFAPAPPASPKPRPAPKGRDLEDQARAKLRKMIGLKVDITAPTWNQILFSSAKIPMRIESPPPAVLKAIDQLPPPDDPAAPPDPVRAEAEHLLSGLSNSRPRPSPPRSIAAGPMMAPPADALARWMRRVFLVVTGPEAARLLVASGYLTPDDVDILEIVYPEGFDEERQAAVGAAIALTNASMRNGTPHDLPSWLNDQLLTLMDEKRPLDVYKDAYAAEAKQAPSNGLNPSSAQPNLIAQQTTPSPAADR